MKCGENEDARQRKAMAKNGNVTRQNEIKPKMT